MSFQRRLDALVRRAREEGHGSEVERCHSCGWPRAGAPRFVVVRVESDADPPTCGACGRHVDKFGRALAGVRSTIVLQGLRLVFGSRSVYVTPGRPILELREPE